MKSGRGVWELWGVENRPLPLTRPMAYTTACTTVQAVIEVEYVEVKYEVGYEKLITCFGHISTSGFRVIGYF